MKKILNLVALAMCVIGIVGGLCVCLSAGYYPIAACIMVSGLCSWPQVRELWKCLTL